MSNKNITRLVVGALSTNCWIYRLDEKNAAVIDPGDEADTIIAALESMSLAPKYILLTHGHFDHIAAVPQLAKAFATNKPQIAIHRLDAEYLGSGAYASHCISARAVMGDTAFIDALWSEMPPPDIQLEEGAAIGPFTVLHLPGHTQGSVAFWDKEAGVLFTGDTLFASGFGRTDLPGGSDEQMVASLRRLFAMDANIEIYPGHDAVSTIGREKR